MKSFYKSVALVFFAALCFLFLIFDEPWQLLLQNWIISPIAFVAAVFANATAIGGGFLFLPLFIFVYGLTPIVALKLSLATQAFGMTAGAVGWSRSFFDPVALIVGGLASLIGMGFGTLLMQVPNELIKPIFGWVSLLFFIALVVEIRFGRIERKHRIEQWDWRLPCYFITVLIGGVVTAWTAIGVGEFVVIYLLFVYGIRIEVSIATGVAILALDSILGLALHAYLGDIRWDLLMFSAPGVLLGGFYGAKAGKYLEQRTRKQVTAASISQHSPLKLVFSAIIFVNSVSILANYYLVN